MFIDSHCHLASHRFARDEVPALIERARVSGIGHLVTLATCLGDLEANLDIAQSPWVHACIGIHPCDVHHAPDDAVERLAGHVGDARVAAVGETGLDYYHPAPEGWSEEDFRERQRVMLRRHFELAAGCGLNVVIHTRDRAGHASFEDALDMYRGFHGSVRAVFHCFIGPWENASRVLELGGLLSFGGVSTFKSAREVREVIARCPRESFMLETDSPYLAPDPHRGQRNEPALLHHTAERIAEVRGESLVSLAEHTGSAARRFFRFHSPAD